MPPLFTLPHMPLPPAANARLLYDQDHLEETVAFCQKELPLLEKEIPAKSQKLPAQEAPATSSYQYYALTALLVEALAELRRWKPAKEALGRYRMHFSRDPWGYTLGAEVTRRDPEVQDREAVDHAAEMLDAEAQRLMGKTKRKVG